MPAASLASLQRHGAFDQAKPRAIIDRTPPQSVTDRSPRATGAERNHDGYRRNSRAHAYRVETQVSVPMTSPKEDS